MEKVSATTPIRAAHQINVAQLEKYLAKYIPAATPIRAIEQFAAGQSNPTYLLEGPERRFVLRKKPPGELLPRAHLVEREYRILEALSNSEVPVPRVHHLCQDPGVIGTSFYVMDHVEGSVDQDPALPMFDPESRRAAFESMGTVLARLHEVDWKELGLCDFGKDGGYIARQIRRWSGQYEASKSDDIPAMEYLMEWLPKNIPDDDETTIVHGDFRPGNLIFHPAEPKVAAVLDWELCTLGHPLGDLAHNCLAFSIPRTDTTLTGLSGADVEAMGIPSESEYVALYCSQAGRQKISNWTFYQAFAFFRMAAICQGVYARGLKGNASAPNALEYHDRAIVIAKIGLEKAIDQG